MATNNYNKHHKQKRYDKTNSKKFITQNIIIILQNEIKRHQPPLIENIIQEFGHNPFLILIGCLISLRAKDITTIHICRKLFKVANAPEKILQQSTQHLEKILFKAGFYRTKAKTILHVSLIIKNKHNGTVPSSLAKLLSIKGIGRKTANLVLGMAYNIPAICVDTHVHRISNRLGIITTQNPNETEHALEAIVEKKYWILWNKFLVVWGQNICTPLAPQCHQCAIKNLCKKEQRNI
jgi:endonuclease III